MPDLSSKIAKTTRPYLFRNSAVLIDLPDKDLEIIRECAKPKKLKRGEVLFRQGTTPRSVVWLISGKAKSSRKPLAVSDRLFMCTQMVT
ncbi:MAG: hypothetical protein IPL92_14940 [Saprospiraceae bacterium]|nr:hypothetical protein [Candidatus Opimibacter iunctus]